MCYDIDVEVVSIGGTSTHVTSVHGVPVQFVKARMHCLTSAQHGSTS